MLWTIRQNKTFKRSMRKRSFWPMKIFPLPKLWRKLDTLTSHLLLLLRDRPRSKLHLLHSQRPNFTPTSSRLREMAPISIVGLRQRMIADWLNLHLQLFLSKQSRLPNLLKVTTLPSLRLTIGIWERNTQGGPLNRFLPLLNCFGKKERTKENLSKKMEGWEHLSPLAEEDISEKSEISTV